jgi:hypothetical protein
MSAVGLFVREDDGVLDADLELWWKTLVTILCRLRGLGMDIC